MSKGSNTIKCAWMYVCLAVLALLISAGRVQGQAPDGHNFWYRDRCVWRRACGREGSGDKRWNEHRAIDYHGCSGALHDLPTAGWRVQCRGLAFWIPDSRAQGRHAQCRRNACRRFLTSRRRGQSDRQRRKRRFTRRDGVVRSLHPH